jgi:DNA-directed RNA polymerase specialized sigma24 family protein
VACAKRDLLLGVHRFRLRREDLEDCYSQAALELIAHVRAGGRFAGRRHIANAIEQRFVSRVNDRRRALAGRSPMQAALEAAASLSVDDPVDVADARAELEKLVLMREELRRIQRHAASLTPDQRLVIACQVGLELSPGDFCRIHGWSLEKYRKVAQRGRARLRSLVAAEDARPSQLRACGRR